MTQTVPDYRQWRSITSTTNKHQKSIFFIPQGRIKTQTSGFIVSEIILIVCFKKYIKTNENDHKHFSQMCQNGYELFKNKKLLMS